MPLRLAGPLLLFACMWTAVGPGEVEAQVTDRALVIFGSDTVRAEVADDFGERGEGLMFRDEVPDGTGMLFVFEREAAQSFWMKNTYVDLDIAFMNAAFRIVDIRQMEAESEQVVGSRAPAMYALEVRRGWFAEQEIRVGDLAEVLFPGIR
jgi:uncharacterized protein